AAHDTHMNTPSSQQPASASDQRRSSRMFTRIPVRASGKDVEGRKFRENSQTIVINAHGGLLYLHESLELGADLTLINPVTEEEQECRVVYVGDTSEKGTRIGVEFHAPSPHFWGVDFAPQDWPARSPGHSIH
ncbi:MAG: hypothetical protein ACRD5R_10060, partial [Candidatus Acidiferrales bacterium]